MSEERRRSDIGTVEVLIGPVLNKSQSDVPRQPVYSSAQTAITHPGISHVGNPLAISSEISIAV